MPKLRRTLIPLVAALAAGGLHAVPAAASSSQETILEEDIGLQSDPVGTLSTLHQLGVTRVRVSVHWSDIAPAQKPANAGDPANYSPAAWAPWDAIVRDAQAEGIGINLLLTGPAPKWANGRGAPCSACAWNPSANDFGAFVTAIGRRYSGSYTPGGAAAPLPKVSSWSIWNEPNYGPDLAPQTTQGNSVENGAVDYRGLLDAAWKGLTASGHSAARGDTILIGETAPRGVTRPGIWSGVKPLRFLRALYCVDSRFRPLRGSAARLRGCPTTAAGTRAFRRAHPALFQAGGYAQHLYSSQSNPQAPTVATNESGHRGVDPEFADLPGVGRLEATLDRANRVYGSHTRYGIWNTEYGYRTRPPDPNAGVSLATAAAYINWAEYLSYRQPRLHSYMQYLLRDPVSGLFASGLEFPNGKPKPSFDAFRMPLFLPVTASRRGRSLEVWGGVRPAHSAQVGTGKVQVVAIQFRAAHRGWTTVARVSIRNVRGYIDARVKFAGSGSVRLYWTSPTGAPYTSRTVSISLR